MSRQYKEFRLDEVVKIKSSKKALHKNQIKNKGEYPYVTRTYRNNGVSDYIQFETEYINPGNTIAFAMDTYILTYQEFSYFTGNKVKIVTYDKINKYNALYLISVVRKQVESRTYNEGMTQKELNAIKIELPITPQGDPDWQYMEDFMKEIESETQQTIETLDKISTLSRGGGGVSSYLEPYGYKEFKVGDLFEYERGARIKKSDRVEGNIPLVTAGKINTGVSGYIEIHNKYEERPCLTIDMFGNTFYRDYPFYYDDNIIVFKNKKYSKWVYLYICGAVSYLQNIYSYTKQFRVKEIDNNYVKIPITPQGDPDWQYMEDFMRNIEQESEEVIKKIQNMS